MTEVEFYKEKICELVEKCVSLSDLEVIYSILVKLDACPIED